LAAIKSTAGTGINNTNQQAKISIKSINGATCSAPTDSPLGAVIDSGTLKASFSGNLSCNAALAPPVGTLPASGKFGFAQAGVVNRGYVRLTANDPAINFFPDVVSVHGIMVKGPLAGADVNGTLSQDPTIKDKTTGSPAYGAFTGVDVNPSDVAQIATSCASGNSTGSLMFNSGVGGLKGPVPVPTSISLTMIADGTSLLERAGLVSPPNMSVPGVPASGLSFSVF
jgi:hypothetical protein